jgi:hypothetical protein
VSEPLTTYGEAAEGLGVSYAVVSGLAEAHGIVPKPVPRSPNAKGLDRADMAVLRRALGLRKGERVGGPRLRLRRALPSAS